VSDLQAAVEVAKEAVGAIGEKEVAQPYTAPSGEEYASLAYHIVILSTHFALHYGQAEYAACYIR
jgi:hypothetical protein